MLLFLSVLLNVALLTGNYIDITSPRNLNSDLLDFAKVTSSPFTTSSRASVASSNRPTPALTAAPADADAASVPVVLVSTETDHHHKEVVDSRAHELLSKNETVAACLLIKDDNAILNEWIAYHYHTVNLRHLIVAVDPSASQTPPDAIFKKWTAATNLQVTVWNDTSFMPESFLQDGLVPRRFRSDLSIAQHRFRQVTFLSACLKRAQSDQHAWTMHIDSDEYVVVNPIMLQQEQESNTNNKNMDMDSTWRIPLAATAGSIVTVLRQVQEDAVRSRQANYPCLSMPRLLFGSVQDNEPAVAASNSLHSSALLHATRPLLETLRWRYHADFDDTERNAQPKVMVDVSNVPVEDSMFRRAFSIHRPSKTLCRRMGQIDMRSFQRYPLAVHHYLGTWDRYAQRHDVRRSREAYETKAHVHSQGTAADDWILSWLDGFVAVHGLELTTTLLPI
jgi:hypothetical protein